MKKGWTLWARKAWTDPEPDTFYMSVESSAPDSQRHVVVSGCATWLSLEQAEEVAEFLATCIELVRSGPTKEFEEAEDDEPLERREFWREQDRQSRELGADGIRK